LRATKNEIKRARAQEGKSEEWGGGKREKGEERMRESKGEREGG